MTSREKKHRFKHSLLEWSKRNQRDFPWRRSGITPYEVLIAELLLKQTDARKVTPVYLEFLHQYPNLSSLRCAKTESVVDLLRPLGLYNQRANALDSISDRLSDSGIPESEAELLDLPYVGRYTANAVLCFGFGYSRPIVDVNVLRAYSRVFEFPDSINHKDDYIWEFAWSMLPEDQARRYNLALLDFGAQICTSRTPSCDECFASEYCLYYQTSD